MCKTITVLLPLRFLIGGRPESLYNAHSQSASRPKRLILKRYSDVSPRRLLHDRRASIEIVYAVGLVTKIFILHLILIVLQPCDCSILVPIQRSSSVRQR